MSRLKRLWRALVDGRREVVIDLTDEPREWLLALERLDELLPTQRQPEQVDWKEYRG